MATTKTRVCPKCGRIVNAQGFGGHLMLAHGIKGLSAKALERQDADARLRVFTERDAWLSRRIDRLEGLVICLFQTLQRSGTMLCMEDERWDRLNKTYAEYFKLEG